MPAAGAIGLAIVTIPLRKQDSTKKAQSHQKYRG
jgi:hypothetical protein